MVRESDFRSRPTGEKVYGLIEKLEAEHRVQWRSGERRGGERGDDSGPCALRQGGANSKVEPTG